MSKTTSPVRILRERAGRLGLELLEQRVEGAAELPGRGYAKLYHERVLPADQGCDFDFLRPEQTPGDPSWR